MKLLLTSGGLRNKSIIAALQDLVGKPLDKVKLTYIPTAANVEEGDKSWLVDDLMGFKKLKFKEFDVVDTSAVPKDVWQPRLEKADIIVVGGGNTFHLIYWLKKSGLVALLPELLKSRVYVGISAGSMVTAKSLMLSSSARLYSEEVGEVTDDEGLGFVGFQLRPHFNSPDFPNLREEKIAKHTQKTTDPIYAIDDDTAIEIVDGKMNIISEGKWKRFN